MTAKGHDKNHLRPCAKFAKRMRRKAERVYASYIFLKLLSRSNVRAHHWHGMGVYTRVKSRRLGGFSSPWPCLFAVPDCQHTPTLIVESVYIRVPGSVVEWAMYTLTQLGGIVIVVCPGDGQHLYPYVGGVR